MKFGIRDHSLKDLLHFFPYLLVFLGIYLTFFPAGSSILDEVGFINQSVLWSKGVFFPDSMEPNQEYLQMGGRFIGWRHPGRPLLNIPFYWMLGDFGLYLPSVLLHLGTVLLFALILVRLGLSPLWGLLVLWHPTLALYSRTVMAGPLATFLLTAALYFRVSSPRPGLLSGLFVGLAALSKYFCGIVLPFFVISLFFDKKFKKKEAFLCATAGGAVGLGILFYNLYTIGTATGFHGNFGASHIPHNIMFYAVETLLLWPGMLLTLFLLTPQVRHLVYPIVIPISLILISYYFHDTAENKLEYLVTGQRLLQPAIPAFVLAYAFVLSRMFPNLSRNRMCFHALALILVAGNFAIAKKHQEHLLRDRNTVEFVRERIPDGKHVAANPDIAKLFGALLKNNPSYRWTKVLEPSELRLIEAEFLLLGPAEKSPKAFALVEAGPRVNIFRKKKR